MTTGGKRRDLRISVPEAGYQSYGWIIANSWMGADSIGPSTPRVSYPVRPILANESMAVRRELLAKYRYNVDQFKAELLRRRLKRREALNKRRLLPPNPYWKTEDKLHHALWWRWIPPMTIPIVGGGLPSNPFMELGDAIPAPDPEQEYKVIAKLRRKAYGSGFNPAVFTAEGRQAFRMIGDAARSLNGALKSLKRLDPKGVAKHLAVPYRDVQRVFSTRRTLSSRWLELQYGWLPLVSDMAEAGTWLAAAINGSEYGKTGKLTARRTWSVSDVVPPDWISQNAPHRASYWTRRVTIFQLQYIIYGVQKSPVMMPSLATLSTIAWEKTPWSFVVDWVVPIGSYLEACRTASDLKGLVVRSLKSHSICLDPAFGEGGFYGWYMPGVEPSESRFRFQRSVSEEINPPNPGKGLADDLTFLTWRRAANAVALLAQNAPAIARGMKRTYRKTSRAVRDIRSIDTSVYTD